MNIRESIYGIEPYNPPKKLVTTEEYRQRVIALGKDKNLTFADDKFFSDLEDLRNDLYDMIVYNTDEIEVKGTKYYISTDGDDNNDGLTPATAWKTLKKASEFKFNEGDGLYLKRGDLWRGNLPLQNGVTYQAYGEGAKPKLYYAIDTKSEGNWLKTDIPDVWVFDKIIDTKDIGVIVFDGGKKYAEKKKQKSELVNDLDFYFSGNWVYIQEEKHENKLYLMCKEGNPNDIFDQIDLSLQGHTIPIGNFQHDITVHNLDIRYGQDYFFNDSSKNIILSYCTIAWMGGHYGGEAINFGCYRFGGGGGAWRACDGMKFLHCHFTQHFDCAMTPQFLSQPDKTNPNIRKVNAANFKDFHVLDCLIEYTEYSFEYFCVHYPDSVVCGQPKYDNMQFNYNICNTCDKGFGNKHGASRFIRSGDAFNNCINTVFENNIFDRSGSVAIQITAYEGDKRRNIPSYDLLPKLKGNIYIDPKDKRYAIVNNIHYDFNSYSQAALERLGVEKDSVYIFTPEE